MKKALFAISLSAVLCAGCASVAITDDAIIKNTSMALGLDKTEFTITNREDSGIKTTYNVKSNNGKNYSCYVTGTVSVVGRTVSDAMCNEMHGTTKPTASTNTSCNALLKAAGQCQ